MEYPGDLSTAKELRSNVGLVLGEPKEEAPLTRRVICVYDFMNSRRSALIWSAWVVGIPCGNP